MWGVCVNEAVNAAVGVVRPAASAAPPLPPLLDLRRDAWLGINVNPAQLQVRESGARARAASTTRGCRKTFINKLRLILPQANVHQCRADTGVRTGVTGMQFSGLYSTDEVSLRWRCCFRATLCWSHGSLRR